MKKSPIKFLLPVLFFLCLSGLFLIVSESSQTELLKEYLIDALSGYHHKGNAVYVSSHIKVIPEVYTEFLYKTLLKDGITDWSKFAYVQYATNYDYAVSAMMNFENLAKYKAKGQFILLATHKTYKRLPKQFKDYAQLINVNVKTVNSLVFDHKGTDKNLWRDGFTKFQVFTLTQFERIIYFDSDSLILANLDQLFFIPKTQLALPLAYDESMEKVKTYLEHNLNDPNNEKLQTITNIPREEETLKKIISLVGTLSSGILSLLLESYIQMNLPCLPNHPAISQLKFGDHFMVVTPNNNTFEELVERSKTKKVGQYDMDILNDVFNISHGLIQNASDYDHSTDVPRISVLPHSVYGVLSGTFKHRDYTSLTTSPQEFLHEAMIQVLEEHKQQNNLKKENKDNEIKRNDESDIFETLIESPATKHTEHGSKFKHLEDETIKISSHIKMIHFSDWPMPKPWGHISAKQDYVRDFVLCEDDKDLLEKFPDSERQPRISQDCVASRFWSGLCQNYKRQRREMMERIESL